jgi:hypothetical protein
MDLKLAIEIVVIIIGIIALMLLGDYIGYKFGRIKLAIYSGYVVLGLIVLFAIYAAVSLLLLS